MTEIRLITSDLIGEKNEIFSCRRLNFRGQFFNGWKRSANLLEVVYTKLVDLEHLTVTNVNFRQHESV
jgi:hypothetical protein